MSLSEAKRRRDENVRRIQELRRSSASSRHALSEPCRHNHVHVGDGYTECLDCGEEWEQEPWDTYEEARGWK